MTWTEVPRDRWGRPVIIQLDGTDPLPYTRVSKLAKSLDDGYNLQIWTGRKAIEGLVRRPDLVTRAAGALATGDPDNDPTTKRELNGILTDAKEAAGASRGASAGTGFHSLTEAMDRGTLDESLVPEADRSRLDDYRRAMHGYKVLDIETFIVNDEVQAAGTFDRLVLCPDGRVRVADLKTGKSEAAYPLATTIQIAIYANGKRYDPDTGTRTPLHAALDTSTGLLIHLPPTGGCTVLPLDLNVGWLAAQTAAEVTAFRSLKAKDIIRKATA